MSRLSFVVLLTLVVAVIAGTLLYQSPGSISIIVDTEEPETPQEVDYYLTGTKSTEFDSSGQLEYEFLAARVEHYPDGNYSLVESPVMQIRQSDGTPWVMTADKARVNHNNEEVNLTDNVEMIRQKTDDQLVINTDQLTVTPRKNEVKTDQAIRALKPGTQIQATGMTADMTNNKLRLLSEVKITHDPHYPL